MATILMDGNFLKEAGKTKTELNEIFNKYEHDVEELADGNTEYNFASKDDVDDIAIELGMVSYHVAKVTGYGNESIEVVMWNYITEEWEHEKTYHREIKDMTEDEYGTLEAATEAKENYNKGC